MYYTTKSIQNASADFEKMLVIPSHLTDFVNRSKTHLNTHPKTREVT